MLDRLGGHWARKKIAKSRGDAAAVELAIRLGSAAANLLSRSRNQRADEDGCLSFQLDACRSGFPVSARLPKTVAPLSSFHPWQRTLKPGSPRRKPPQGYEVRTV